MGNIEKAVKLTDYFVALPKSRWMLLGILILGILLGIGMDLNKYSGFELVLKGAFEGIMILTIPAFLSAVTVKLLIFKIPFKRIVATTFIGEMLYAITYGIGWFVSSFNPVYAKFIFLIGAALVFVLWYSIARLVFTLKYRSLLFAVIQLLFHLIFLLSASIVDFGAEPVSAIAKFYIAAAVFLIAIYLFFLIINAPTRRNFGVTSTDAFSMFAAQWLYQDKELEDVFESVGETAKIPVTVMAFERKNNNTYFVIPCLHYGPFGNLGGSEFSSLINQGMNKEFGGKTFVFHGTATHDLNPISSNELPKVMDAIKDCMKGAKFTSCKIGFARGEEKECFSETLLFGNEAAFISVSRAPLVTEDINFGLGSLIASEAEKKVKLAGIADQHNAETGEVTSFEPGSLVGYRYLEAVRNAISAKPEMKKLELGVAQRDITSPFVGKAGLKVAVFSTDPMTAIIVLDSNGMTPEFREKLIAEAKKVGQKYKKELHPVIFTTDTHQINSVRGVLNPLREDAGIIQQMQTAIADAILDMSEAKFFANKKWFEIDVLGAKQSIEIISTVNSIVAVAKIAGPLILLASIAALIAIIGLL